MPYPYNPYAVLPTLPPQDATDTLTAQNAVVAALLAGRDPTALARARLQAGLGLAPAAPTVAPSAPERVASAAPPTPVRPEQFTDMESYLRSMLAANSQPGQGVLELRGMAASNPMEQQRSANLDYYLQQMSAFQKLKAMQTEAEAQKLHAQSAVDLNRFMMSPEGQAFILAREGVNKPVVTPASDPEVKKYKEATSPGSVFGGRPPGEVVPPNATPEQIKAMVATLENPGGAVIPYSDLHANYRQEIMGNASPLVRGLTGLFSGTPFGWGEPSPEDMAQGVAGTTQLLPQAVANYRKAREVQKRMYKRPFNLGAVIAPPLATPVFRSSVGSPVSGLPSGWER